MRHPPVRPPCIQAYRYHWSRTDHRHNFAAEFYYEYLHIGRPAPDWSTRFFAKLPQSLTTFLFGMLNSRDPPWCFFMCTMAFVTFNPVVRDRAQKPYLLPFSPPCGFRLVLVGSGSRFSVRRLGNLSSAQITSQYFTWWMNWLPLVIPVRACC